MAFADFAYLKYEITKKGYNYDECKSSVKPAVNSIERRFSQFKGKSCMKMGD
jgi:hypothetical protein